MNKKIFIALIILFAGMGFFITSVLAQNTPPTAEPSLEVYILDNDQVLVRGARVTSISENLISARTAWGEFGMDWDVETDDSRFLRRFGEKSVFSEIFIGDFISFSGTLDSSAEAPTVVARVVKNWSTEGRGDLTVRAGSIRSIDELSNSFSLRTQMGTVVVRTNSHTEIKHNLSNTSFGVLTSGSDVLVRGTFNTQTGVLAANMIIVSK